MGIYTPKHSDDGSIASLESADMAAGEFRPFNPGPRGGQVGQWILHGDNFNKLKAITNSAQFRMNAVAPIGRKSTKQRSTPQRLGPQIHANLEHGRWLKAAEMPELVRARQVLLAGGKSLPKHLAQMNGTDLGLILNSVKSSANETVRRVLARQSTMQTGIASGASRLGGISPSGDAARSISAAIRYVSMPVSAGPVLPSFAPIKKNAQLGADAVSKSLPMALDDYQVPIEANAVGRRGISSTREPFKFSEALEEHFMRQARLPPSGSSAFDPRLTPAWAGVKLPV